MIKKNNTPTLHLPAEWEPQSGVMLTWPHRNTDWKPYLDEAIRCFTNIAQAIIRKEKLLIVCASINDVKAALGNIDLSRIIFREIPSDDTWARDHGPIAIRLNNTPYIYDFAFNGWGLKFPAERDNQITRKLYDSHAFSPRVGYQDMLHVVLEGGSIESDGTGTLLTTSRCLLSKNRNEYTSKEEIAAYLQVIFGLKRILWLDKGYLAGDDTDGHIDTLARFCNPQTIAYVQCTDESDEHFKALSQMERELQKFKTPANKSYRLIPLPMADPVYEDGERLPATYANFLIINGAILMPVYNSPLDEIACSQLQQAFPNREIISINCLPLIKQHGSLHCVTMQLPEGFWGGS
ncbi:MAG: agmatine deiminase family protein [Dysgonamonadaceae bacterium]|jgi:agmatine/peptidylarginine deiminase|nr:agmatine deiminase family protein [Dysgonamonadaceae bacterium]